MAATQNLKRMRRKAQLGAILLIPFIVAQTGEAQTRLGPGPVEPADNYSFLVGHSPFPIATVRNFQPSLTYDIRDDELAKWVFGTPTTPSPIGTAYGTVLFTLGQCNSGGFINNLGYVGGQVHANFLRPNVGVAASANWDQCSFTAGNPAENTFLKPWAQAVDAPHPGDDTFLGAFNAAVANDPNSDVTKPQYFGNGVDDATLDSLGGNNNFAILFVGDTYGRPDYFNDISRMRDVLINEYGYTDGSIYALYGDGMHMDASTAGAADLPNWIDGPGTKQDLSATIDGLPWVPNDGLFFWASNHGVIPEPGSLVLIAAGTLLCTRRSRSHRRDSVVFV